MYVLAELHGTGAAAALMNTSYRAAEQGASCVWLGANRNNERAQRFYRKCGFVPVGDRSFRLGSAVNVTL